MKAKLLYAAILFAVVSMLFSCSKEDEVETTYWTNSQLYGMWIQDDDPDLYINFFSPNKVTWCRDGRLAFGLFKQPNSVLHEIAITVTYSNKATSDYPPYSVYSFEWLNEAKTRFYLDGRNYTKK